MDQLLLLLNKIFPEDSKTECQKDKKYSHQKIEKFSTTLIKLYN